MSKGVRHRRRLVWASNLLVFAVILLGIQWWQTRDLSDGPAPPLAGRLADGRSVDLRDYRGQTLLVHFWADWCPICRAQEDTIDRLSRSYPVLTVATQSGDADRISDYLRQRQLGIAVLPDQTGELAGSWNVRGVPTSFVVAPGGAIASASTGYTTEIGLRLRIWMAGR